MLCFWWVCVAHLFSFLCCVFGGVRVAHLFSFLCCVFGGSVLLIFLVFCVVFFVCLFCPMSCLVNFANFSGLYILDCPFGFLSRLFTNDI